MLTLFNSYLITNVELLDDLFPINLNDFIAYKSTIFCALLIFISSVWNALDPGFNSLVVSSKVTRKRVSERGGLLS